MCGIVGTFGLDQRPVPNRGDVMNEALIHRGPDEGGVHHDSRAMLGMRRLSVIGVSNGRQPITNETGDLVLVMNGEIYNHRELRAELESRGHQFSCASDAEVAIHLYEERGPDFVDALRGMFGIAIYDIPRGRLILARDRSGKKPLYHAVCDGRLVFASEIKAIHASGLVPKERDPDGLRSYLAFGFVVGEGTMFKGVRKLGAGEMLIAENGTFQIHRYWDYPVSTGRPDGVRTMDEAAERVADLFDAAVERRLESEVPLGAFLSGGVDSSAVVATMRKSFEGPLRTFSVGFEDARLDELPAARQVADRFGTEHHELALRGVSPELLREINYHHDEPAGDPASVPTYCLSHFARRHITVALTGEGGDEIFAGYRHHRYCQRIGALEARIPGLRAAARGIAALEPILGRWAPAHWWKGAWLVGLPAEERVRGFTAAFTDRDLGRILGPNHVGDPDRVPRLLRALARDVDTDDPVALLLYLDSRTGLADHLLMKVDKMGMAASLEARCPLLDQELVEFGASLPTEWKLGPTGSKLVFRRAIERIVPPEILSRPKQGFDVPLDTWLDRDLGELVQRLLLDDRSPLMELVDGEALQGLWAKFQGRHDERTAFEIWRLLNLGVWHELHWPRGILDACREGSRPTEELFVEREQPVAP